MNSRGRNVDECSSVTESRVTAKPSRRTVTCRNTIHLRTQFSLSSNVNNEIETLSVFLDRYTLFIRFVIGRQVQRDQGKALFQWNRNLSV